jgi:hypothetical protein
MERATNQDVPDFCENTDDSSYGLEQRPGIMHWSLAGVLADFASRAVGLLTGCSGMSY